MPGMHPCLGLARATSGLHISAVLSWNYREAEVTGLPAASACMAYRRWRTTVIRPSLPEVCLTTSLSAEMVLPFREPAPIEISIWICDPGCNISGARKTAPLELTFRVLVSRQRESPRGRYRIGSFREKRGAATVDTAISTYFAFKVTELKDAHSIGPLGTFSTGRPIPGHRSEGELACVPV